MLVAASGIAGAERRILYERGVRRERLGDRDDRRQRLVVDPDEPRRLLRRIEGLGRDRDDRLAVVVRLVDRDHWAIPVLGAESRDRLRQVGRAEREPHAPDGEGCARIDVEDPRASAVERHELGVQDALQVDVGHIGLAARDPLDPADAGRRIADAAGQIAGAARPHRASSSAASSTASKICS